MNKMVSFLLLVFFLFPPLAIGNESRQFKHSENDTTYTLYITGRFDQASKANLNDLIFSGSGSVGEEALIGDFIEYRFLGRTGEKTFDLGYKSNGNGVAAESDSKLSVYFNKKEPLKIPLDFIAAYSPGCKTTDFLLLKMINLKGNSLDFQLILPSCLKNK